MAAATFSAGIPVLTQCEFHNHAGGDQYITLDSQNYWHGYGDPPKVIQDKQSGNFKHSADAKGSIGGVVYVLPSTLKWIVAWCNEEEQPNKVYTQIIDSTTAIDWDDIKTNLAKSGIESTDKKLAYVSEVKIVDQSSATPTLKAKLRPTI